MNPTLSKQKVKKAKKGKGNFKYTNSPADICMLRKMMASPGPKLLRRESILMRIPSFG